MIVGIYNDSDKSRHSVLPTSPSNISPAPSTASVPIVMDVINLNLKASASSLDGLYFGM
jgi:hypothetical protein